jgi:hypothetical protein
MVYDCREHISNIVLDFGALFVFAYMLSLRCAPTGKRSGDISSSYLCVLRKCVYKCVCARGISLKIRGVDDRRFVARHRCFDLEQGGMNRFFVLNLARDYLMGKHQGAYQKVRITPRSRSKYCKNAALQAPQPQLTRANAAGVVIPEVNPLDGRAPVQSTS